MTFNDGIREPISLTLQIKRSDEPGHHDGSDHGQHGGDKGQNAVYCTIPGPDGLHHIELKGDNDDIVHLILGSICTYFEEIPVAADPPHEPHYYMSARTDTKELLCATFESKPKLQSHNSLSFHHTLYDPGTGAIRFEMEGGSTTRQCTTKEISLSPASNNQHIPGPGVLRGAADTGTLTIRYWTPQDDCSL